jgi:flagellar hook-associated protein FlgK
MSGLSMVLNTAKQALAAQQIGLNVTGHNIANVDTPSFSRQSAVQTTPRPANFGGLTLGTGVKVDSVVRSSDNLLENRLMDQNSTLARYQEAQSYMSILENLFNENSDTSLSSRLSAFWNGWNDLSNNPTGASERLGVYDSGVQTAEQFQSLSDNMRQIQTDLNQEIDAGVENVNTLAKQIADINLDIVANSQSNPNDQKDKRNALVTQLSQLMDLQAYEQPNGSLTVATGTGHVLVSGGESYQLETRSGEVNWVNSHGEGVDITDRIKGGKLGGWIEMRDEIIPEVNQDLNALAEGFIWSVNLQHSQGVGLNFFSDALTGASQTNSSGQFDTLDFGDRIDYSGDFKMWVKNTGALSPALPGITVPMGVSTAIPTYVAGPPSFSTPNTYYEIKVINGGTVNAEDIDFEWRQGGVGGWTSVTMLSGTNSVTIDGQPINFTNGNELISGNMLTVNTDGDGDPSPLNLTASGTANSAMDTYVFTVKGGGVIGTNPIEIEWSNGATSGAFTVDPAAVPAPVDVDGMTLNFAGGTVFAGDSFTVATNASGTPDLQLPSEWHWTLSSFADAFNRAADVSGGGVGLRKIGASVTSNNELKFTPKAGYEFAFSDDQVQDSGVAAALGFNTFFTGLNASDIGVNRVLQDKDYIAAARVDGTTGEYGAGDNRNAIDIAGLQYVSQKLAQWSFDRRNGDRSEVASLTAEGYYQGMIGTIGIKSASINRNTEFNRITMSMITDQRNSISGVNLDEEMVNLMKYQQGFAVASKLLTTANEMMQTLLDAK